MNVNIGTEEHPIYVPEEAVHPDTDEGQEWWEMLAEGSVSLPADVLEALLTYLELN